MTSSPHSDPFTSGDDTDLFEVASTRVLFEDSTETDRYTRLWDWTWCIKLSADARAMYCYLRYRAGSKSKSWPERSVLADVLGMSLRKVHDVLHEIEHNGLIDIVDRRKEHETSEFIIKSKASVASRQSILQNLQDPKPLAKSATKNCKSRKTDLQILQFDKGTVDTRTVDTPVDTKERGDSATAGTTHLSIVDDPFGDIDDLPEWGPVHEPLATAHDDTSPPTQEQSSVEAMPATPKARTRAAKVPDSIPPTPSTTVGPTEQQQIDARRFLDAFSEIKAINTRAGGGYWTEALAAVVAAAPDTYSVDDLMGCCAYKVTDPRKSDRIRPKHVVDDVFDWIKRGRPATYQSPRPMRGVQQAIRSDAPSPGVGMGAPIHTPLGGKGQTYPICWVCGRRQGAQHHTPRCGKSGQVMEADCA